MGLGRGEGEGRGDGYLERGGVKTLLMATCGLSFPWRQEINVKRVLKAVIRRPHLLPACLPGCGLGMRTCHAMARGTLKSLGGAALTAVLQLFNLLIRQLLQSSLLNKNLLGLSEIQQWRPGYWCWEMVPMSPCLVCRW